MPAPCSAPTRRSFTRALEESDSDSALGINITKALQAFAGELPRPPPCVPALPAPWPHFEDLKLCGSRPKVGTWLTPIPTGPFTAGGGGFPAQRETKFHLSHTYTSHVLMGSKVPWLNPTLKPQPYKPCLQYGCNTAI